MTVLVGLHHPTKGVFIGCDRRASNSYQVFDYLPTKWIVSEYGWAVGHTGHLRTLNLIEYHQEALFKNLESPMDFTFRVTEMLEESGYKAVDEGRDEPLKTFCQSYLLANPNGLWEIDTSMCIIQAPHNELMAGGSGMLYALGAGFATRDEKDPAKRVETALRAAIQYDPLCGGEPWIAQLSVKK